MKFTTLALFLGAVAAVKLQQTPLKNECVNANKATTKDELCNTPGNSAWNTITTARSGNPEKAVAQPYPDHSEHVMLEQTPLKNACVNTNKATQADEPCNTAGNSAWNTVTTARSGNPEKAVALPYPGHAEHVMIDQTPLKNECVNANKATTKDELCNTPGNSAWNTITTARSGNPEQAVALPYPDHKLH